MSQDKGHCKHGEFDLMAGCPQCIAERQAGEESQEAFTGVPFGEGVVATSSEGSKKPPTETALVIPPGADTEVMSYHQEALKLQEYAVARLIGSVEDLAVATDDLITISNLKKTMEAKRVELVKPKQDEVKTIQDTYKTLMAPVFEADRITRQKMTTFQLEQDRKAREAEQVNREAQELARKQAALSGTGEITVDTTPVEVPSAPKVTRTDVGTSGLVANWKYRVVDIEKLPREYMVPDDAMLKSIAKQHHDKKPVPGVEFYNEPGMAVRSR